MTGLTTNERRLVLEAAFAGVNHRLHQQVQAILPALPLLVADDELQAVCRAILLTGLNQPECAHQTLTDISLPEADLLRRWLIR